MYQLIRKQRYNHRTTAEVTWRVVNTETANVVAECSKKKDAQRWLDLYTLSKEEMVAKYPELAA